MSKFLFNLDEKTCSVELNFPRSLLKRVFSGMLACLVTVLGTLGLKIELKSTVQEDFSSEVLE